MIPVVVVDTIEKCAGCVVRLLVIEVVDILQLLGRKILDILTHLWYHHLYIGNGII